MRPMISTPQLRGVSVIRCDANGVEADGGAYFKISALVNHAAPCEISCSYSQIPDGPSSGTITIIPKGEAVPTKLETGALGGDLDATESYSVSVTLTHDSGSNGTVIILQGESVFMHKDGAKNSISIGEKVTKENTVSIAEKMAAIIKGLLVLQSANNFTVTASGLGINMSDGEKAALINAGYFGIGDKKSPCVGFAYDGDRGYVFINDAPENPTDATNKAYVDTKINALRKELGLEEE